MTEMDPILALPDAVSLKLLPSPSSSIPTALRHTREVGHEITRVPHVMVNQTREHR
jgi:hypothetical protein